MADNNTQDISQKTKMNDMLDYKSLIKRFLDALMKQGFAVMLLFVVCAFTAWLSFNLINRIEQMQVQHLELLEKSHEKHVQDIKDCTDSNEEFMKAMIEELKK